jgi:hypothetical protein
MNSKLSLLVATCALLASVARAQSDSGFYGPLTLAPADAAASGGGGGAGDDAKANAADLAKTLANPIGALISVPFQNNFDFGAGPDGDGFQYKLNLQPIVPISLNEDWDNEQWTVPLNLMVQQLVKVGKQPVALTVGGRYYAEKPDGGPDWGLRFAVIFLFPK